MAVVLGADGVPEQGEFPALTPVVLSSRWGETYPLVFRAKNGKFFVPGRVRAGNVWSSAIINDQVARQLGGTPGQHQEVIPGNKSNPWGPNYGAPDKVQNFSGFWFSQAPDPAQLEASAQFVPGRGTSNKAQLQGLGLLAAAITAGAALAPAAAGGIGQGAGTGLVAKASDAATLSELGTGGGLGLSTGSAGSGAASILGNSAAIAPAGLPGTGLSLSGAAGGSAAASFGAGTIVAGGVGMMGSPASSVLNVVNQPATSPFTSVPVVPPPTVPPVAPVSNAITGAFETLKTGAATVKAGAELVGTGLTLKALLTGKSDSTTTNLGDTTMFLPATDQSATSMPTAPRVTVVGKTDNTFFLLLAGLGFLAWRIL